MFAFTIQNITVIVSKPSAALQRDFIAIFEIIDKQGIAYRKVHNSRLRQGFCGKYSRISDRIGYRSKFPVPPNKLICNILGRILFGSAIPAIWNLAFATPIISDPRSFIINKEYSIGRIYSFINSTSRDTLQSRFPAIIIVLITIFIRPCFKFVIVNGFAVFILERIKKRSIFVQENNPVLARFFAELCNINGIILDFTNSLIPSRRILPIFKSIDSIYSRIFSGDFSFILRQIPISVLARLQNRIPIDKRYCIKLDRSRIVIFHPLYRIASDIDGIPFDIGNVRSPTIKGV